MIRRLIVASLISASSGIGTTHILHILPGQWAAVVGVVAGAAVWTWAVIA